MKNRLMAMKDGLAKALSKLKEEKKELAEAIAAEKKAEEHAELMEHAENEADEHHDDAHTKLKDAKEDVNTGADKVEAEVTDLEECKRQLREARKELKSLIEEKAKAEKAKA